MRRIQGDSLHREKTFLESLKHRNHRRAAMGIFVIAASVPTLARAAVFNCPAGDVACLVSAINTANGSAEADTILLEAGVYTLTTVDNETNGPNGLPSITTSIVIQGAGPAATTLQRFAPPDPLVEPLFRILHVSAGGTLMLNALTIRNGNLLFMGSDGGAGILSLGRATLTNCTVTNNGGDFTFGGGGIQNDGTMLIMGSRVEGNFVVSFHAGGILNRGTLEISQSTISGNVASFGFGGGIRNGGSASISNSAIAGNRAGEGGGIANVGGTLVVENSTISGNEALFPVLAGGVAGGGGFYVRNGTVSLNNCTIAENRVDTGTVNQGGGVLNDDDEPGTVELRNTILALNVVEETFGSPEEGPDCFGSIASLGNNLVGDPSDCTIAFLTSDLTGDSGLDAFQDNETPGNGHFPLLETSQAVDAGDPASCTPTDQLGHFRIDGDGDDTVICDIGAIEFFPDADEDGVPDPLDECANSDLGPTVVVGGCDSGVENVLLPGGCTITDLVMQCAVGARNHGAFVRCVAHTTNDLMEQGILTGAQKGAIQRCAAGAAIP